MTQPVRASRLLPDEQGEVLRGDIACYARAVVADEWPTMRVGIIDRLIAPSDQPRDPGT
jgi:hypothetical protein